MATRETSGAGASRGSAGEPALSARCFIRAPLPIPGHPSPGSIQGCRVAAKLFSPDGGDAPWSRCDVFVASGPDVMRVQVPWGCCSGQDVPRGKDGLLLPATLPAGTLSSQVLPTSALGAHGGREIQTLACSSGSSANESANEGGSLLAAVDSRGGCRVWALAGDSASPAAAPAEAQFLPPTDCGIHESRWSGVCFPQPSSSSQGLPTCVAVARSSSRALELFDLPTGSSLRCLHTPAMPAAITFLRPDFSEQPLLACCQAHHVSVWDFRAGEKGGCVQRLSVSPSGEPLFALAVPPVLHSEPSPSAPEALRSLAPSAPEAGASLASSQPAGAFSGSAAPAGGASWSAPPLSHILAVGGAERTVSVVDLRKWTPLDHWKGCLKHDVTSLCFSGSDPEFVYVSGLDQEVVCGRWRTAAGEERGSRKALSFRGDGHWSGMTVAGPRDTFVGWCQSKSLFLAALDAPGRGTTALKRKEVA